MLRQDGMGHIVAGGCLYDNTPVDLARAAVEWRRCARHTLRSAQEDTDPIYRSMGAAAVRYRRKVALALKAGALRLQGRERNPLVICLVTDVYFDHFSSWGE